MLLLPARTATAGTIQQREAAIAENTVALISVPDDFNEIIQFEAFQFAD